MQGPGTSESSSPSASGGVPPSPVEPEAPLAVPGQILGGRYQVEGTLGEGGMGVVFLARHVELEQAVAIKFLKSELAKNPVVVQRFLNEGRAAAALRSPHVVRVMDVGQLPGGEPYLVMERLEGIDLDALVERRGALAVPLATRYAIEACEGLAEAHEAGIIHRDVKPENLFLARDGRRKETIKVVDFGLAKRLDAARAKVVTGPQDGMGSPCYMSPEQITSARSVDARTDVWAMGVVLYRLLSGRLPFDGDTLSEVCSHVLNAPPRPLRELCPGIPAELDAIVNRCLQKNAAARYASARELGQALEHFRQFQPTTAGRAAMPSVHESRNPATAVVVSIGVVAALVALAAATNAPSRIRAFAEGRASFATLSPDVPVAVHHSISMAPLTVASGAALAERERERVEPKTAPEEPATPPKHEAPRAERHHEGSAHAAEAPAAPPEPALSPEEIERRREAYQRYLRKHGLTPLRDVLERMDQSGAGSK